MSFLKISDPAKRDSIVKEYLDLRKNIRDNFLREKTGEQDLQTDISKFFKPITETQKATAREITEELKPIKEGIENLPQTITFPAYPSIKASSEPSEETDRQYITEVAANALGKYLRGNEADRTFGLRDKGGKCYIGDRQVKIKGNDIEFFDKSGVVEKTYEGTPGLWELITSKEPDDKIIMRNDLDNYSRLMVKTNSIYRDNDPNNNNPKGNRRGAKWENFHKYIWDKREKYKEEHTGSGVIIISSDPNTLLERLDLLLASQKAGHTGVGNELVSICDELKRQGVLDTNACKKN